MKRIFAAVLCVAVLLSLCACGKENKKENNAVEGIPFEDVAGIAPEDRPALSGLLMKQDYTLGEYLASGQTIWYELAGTPGKDALVRRIYVIEPKGTLYVMEHVPYRLGELSRMTDGEIAAMVKTEHTKQLSCTGGLLDRDKHSVCLEMRPFVIDEFALVDGLYEKALDPEALTELVLQGCDDEALRKSLRDGVAEFVNVWLGLVEKLYMDRYAVEYFTSLLLNTEDYEAVLEYEIGPGVLPDEVMQDLDTLSGILYELSEIYYDYEVADAEDFLEAATPSPYRLTIVSDSTGNNTSYMELVYLQTYRNGTTSIEKRELSYMYPAGQGGGNSKTVVYDSLYGGYYNDGDYFFTRVDKNLHFMLDEVGTKDIPVDVKDRSTLFAE